MWVRLHSEKSNVNKTEGEMYMISVENALSDLEILSGVRIVLVKDEKWRKLSEWSAVFPAAITSAIYNKFQDFSIMDHLNEGCICHMNHMFIHNLYIPVGQNSYVVVGPYTTGPLSVDGIKNRLKSYEITLSSSSYKFFSDDLPVVPESKIESVRRIVCHMFRLDISEDKILKFESSDELMLADLSPEDTADRKKMLYRYNAMQKIISAISEGDFEKCVQIISENSHYRINKHFSFKDLENEKISGIYIGALFFSAAVNAGISPDTADSLYIHQIRKNVSAETPQEIQNINLNMLHSFCSLVKAKKEEKHPKLVRQIINYLSINIPSQLNIEELCDTFKISPAKLDGLFKKECHATISQYYRQMRLEKASFLLKIHSISVNQVAMQTGFLDQNYFSRIFKSTYGCTPSQYRERYRNI